MRGAILLTGFGPFPGAPHNPTGPLVRTLARRGGRRVGGLRCIAHVFETSYAAVDREFPTLVARERPRALIMFGLALSATQIRIETRARNALSATVPDASGHLPAATLIAPDAPDARQLRAPAQRLAAIVRAAGMRAAISADAGSYLCNYLCWRASEAGARPDGPRIIAFIHVPRVRHTQRRAPKRGQQARRRRPKAGMPLTLDDLAVAGAAIVKFASAASRIRR
jgi:pyroglutamyl-peptidase